MKKILFILHLPPPVHGSAIVGQCIKQSKLLENTFDAKFINLSTSLSVDEIGKYSIGKFSRYIKLIFNLIRFLIGFKPETVYLAITAKGVGFYKDLPIALLAKLFKKKVVLHFHNKGVSANQHRIIDHFLYKRVFKNSKVILLSERLFEDISKYVDKDDVFYCPNGIPIIEFLNNNRTTPNTIPQLLFLSNLIESKGVYTLLDALAILKNEGVVFHCNLVGGEGDVSFEQLRFKIQSLKLDNCVTYLGAKYDQEKYEILSSSYCMIFPTYYEMECYPLVLLEAMMFGLPIISTNHGGIYDIVKHKETGFIVKEKSPKNLAVKIEELINNPQLAEQMGEKGKTRFLEYNTLEIFEQNFINIITQV